jgi:hypothetical protein
MGLCDSNIHRQNPLCSVTAATFWRKFDIEINHEHGCRMVRHSPFAVLTSTPIPIASWLEGFCKCHQQTASAQAASWVS